ncbi:cytochrome C [Phaeovulum sp. NW3]|uniref:c-type cytochrome n=1 Tax=Phaeovulum sp. NW3 TaxID=2934933 RepID=UPI00201FE5F7|nr:cytochrome C [Phaeovulum sp. NW3]MCL7465114.1 cytochrome C [Phaeovulum sp. NW3]
MKTRVIIRLAATLGALALVTPAAAQDVAAGEKEFAKCKACHAIVADDGTEIVKGGKVGPNLYGVVGRKVGGLEGFKYKESIIAVGESGLVWDEAELAAYMTDPKAWLVEKTGDAAAKTGMTFKQKSKQADLAAYLASVVN